MIWSGGKYDTGNGFQSMRQLRYVALLLRITEAAKLTFWMIQLLGVEQEMLLVIWVNWSQNI